jgi:hypothetical protein
LCATTVRRNGTTRHEENTRKPAKSFKYFADSSQGLALLLLCVFHGSRQLNHFYATGISMNSRPDTDFRPGWTGKRASALDIPN